MADQTGLSEYPVLLACGDQSRHVIDGQTIMICRPCSVLGPVYVDIVAFETREFHVKCQQCRAGKWTGKDETAAYRFKAAHARTKGHHQIVVDFMIPDHVKRTWKIHYGNKRTPGRYFPNAAP